MTASRVTGRRLRLAAVIAAGMLAGGVAAVPLVAQGSGRSTDPTITVTVGGDRTGDESVGGLAGVTFTVTGRGFTTTCGPTNATGMCTTADVPANASYTITPTSLPDGWRSNPTLGVGTVVPNTVAPVNYGSLTVQVGSQNVSVPFAAPNSSSATSRGSTWALSRANPPVPAQCGLKVALLFDLSASIGGNLGTYLSAGQDFVSALEGTPSSVGVYTFATSAPAAGASNGTLEATPVSTAAGVATVNAKIAGLTLPTGTNALGIDNGFTNWDQGLWQIANDQNATSTPYNAVIVLTDGDPTRFGPMGQGGPPTGVATRLLEVENAIFSANALKAKGTSVLAVGINLAGAGSLADLAAISGPTEGQDFFTTNFSELESLLLGRAELNCEHTVNVTKLVVPSGNAANDTTGAEPLPGWNFDASAPAGVTPASATTNETGAVSFKVSGSTPQPVTVTEGAGNDPALTPFPVDGNNATCTPDTGFVNEGTTGFTVTSEPAGTVACEVFDQAPPGADPAEVVVDKDWVINGQEFPEGTQDAAFQAALTLDPNATGAEPEFGVPLGGFSEGDTVNIGENVTVPPGCTNETSGDTGDQHLAAGTNTFQITNTVTCTSTLTLVKMISNPVDGLTPPPVTSWTLTATPESGGSAVISGTSPATGTVASDTRFVLAESNVPGWRQSTDPASPLAPGATGSWQCFDTDVNGTDLEDFTGGDGTVVVPPGEHVTCTAVNEPAAALTLVKRVINHGGTAVPGDFTLTADPGAPIPPAPAPSGTSGSSSVTRAVIEAGIPYTLRESGPAGYGLSSLACIRQDGQAVPLSGSTFTAGFRQVITCTFTNTQSVPVTG